MAIGNNQDDTRQTAKRLLKGSAAFTSALLFGNRDTGSKGLLWTLGAATGMAAVGAAKALASAPSTTSSQGGPEEPSPENMQDGWRNGHAGYGYYFGNHRMDIEDEDF